MKKQDFRTAFGKPDADFVSCVQNTLHRLREEERPMKRKLSLSAAIAVAACLILATAAFAAVSHWGLFDFLNQGRDSGALPEAAEIVATDPPQQGGAGKLASFRLREAVYDGEYVYMVVDATPADGILLLGPGLLPPDAMRDLTKEDSDAMTIGEYAGENDLQMAIVGISTAAAAEGAEDAITSFDWRLEADGTLVFMLSGEAPQGMGDAFETTLLCSVTPLVSAAEGEGITMQYFEEDGEEPVSKYIGYAVDESHIQRSELAFALSAAGPAEAQAYDLDAAYPGCGVRVERVTFEPSPMALYYEIRFTITDEAAYAATEDGVQFEFLDANGERLPDGATMSGQTAAQADGSLVQSGSLSAQSDPSQIAALRAFNCWTKERYESHELTLEP